MARPRTPKAIREMEGTLTPSKDYGEPDLPEATSLDPPPSLISPDAVNYWHKLVGLLKPVHVISEADLEALLHLCNLHARCVKLWVSGMAPTAADLTQLRLMFREFGLTPASRSMTSQLSDDSNDPAEKFFTGPQAADG